MSRDSVVLVDDYIWVDLARKGFTKQVWLFKTDWEPFVHREFFADGSDRVDYIVLAGWIAGQLDAYPTARGAIERSDVIKSFGDGVITIRKVVR